jgi:hypothetical protein
MKKLIFLIIMLFTLSGFQVSASPNNEGYRNNVVVEKISATRITLSGVEYAISPQAKVGFYDFRLGDVFLRHGKLSDVQVGETVVVKVQGSAVFEIMLSR